MDIKSPALSNFAYFWMTDLLNKAPSLTYSVMFSTLYQEIPLLGIRKDSTSASIGVWILVLITVMGSTAIPDSVHVMITSLDAVFWYIPAFCISSCYYSCEINQKLITLKDGTGRHTINLHIFWEAFNNVGTIALPPFIALYCLYATFVPSGILLAVIVLSFSWSHSRRPR